MYISLANVAFGSILADKPYSILRYSDLKEGQRWPGIVISKPVVPCQYQPGAGAPKKKHSLVYLTLLHRQAALRFLTGHFLICAKSSRHAFFRRVSSAEAWPGPASWVQSNLSDEVRLDWAWWAETQPDEACLAPSVALDTSSTSAGSAVVQRNRPRQEIEALKQSVPWSCLWCNERNAASKGQERKKKEARCARLHWPVFIHSLQQCCLLIDRPPSPFPSFSGRVIGPTKMSFIHNRMWNLTITDTWWAVCITDILA